eukprot:scaffold2381_cov97-Isochrysis_galbana.AAC.1
MLPLVPLSGPAAVGEFDCRGAAAVASATNPASARLAPDLREIPIKGETRTCGVNKDVWGEQGRVGCEWQGKERADGRERSGRVVGKGAASGRLGSTSRTRRKGGLCGQWHKATHTHTHTPALSPCHGKAKGGLCGQWHKATHTHTHTHLP